MLLVHKLPATTDSQIHARQLSQESLPDPHTPKGKCFCWPFCPKPIERITVKFFEPRTPTSPIINKRIDKVKLIIRTEPDEPKDDFKEDIDTIVVTPRITSAAVSNYVSKVMAEPI